MKLLIAKLIAHIKVFIDHSNFSPFKNKYSFCFFICFGAPLYSEAQQPYSLEIKSIKDEISLNKITYKKTFSTKTERQKELQSSGNWD